jgi:hypothetical protein
MKDALFGDPLQGKHQKLKKNINNYLLFSKGDF